MGLSAGSVLLQETTLFGPSWPVSHHGPHDSHSVCCRILLLFSLITYKSKTQAWVNIDICCIIFPLLFGGTLAAIWSELLEQKRKAEELFHSNKSLPLNNRALSLSFQLVDSSKVWVHFVIQFCICISFKSTLLSENNGAPGRGDLTIEITWLFACHWEMLMERPALMLLITAERDVLVIDCTGGLLGTGLRGLQFNGWPSCSRVSQVTRW